eukprot:795180-Pelagomonas_calceolata.AAC.1
MKRESAEAAKTASVNAVEGGTQCRLMQVDGAPEPHDGAHPEPRGTHQMPQALPWAHPAQPAKPAEPSASPLSAAQHMAVGGHC